MNTKMKPIQLDFKPSITLTLIICIMGLGAGAILILPTLIWQIKLLLGFLIFLAVIYYVCMYGLLLLPWSPIALNINSSNQVYLVCKNGERFPAHVCSDSVVTPYLTVVNFRIQAATLLERLFTKHLIVMPDMLDAEAYRQLRVWLRWGNFSHI